MLFSSNLFLFLCSFQIDWIQIKDGLEKTSPLKVQHHRCIVAFLTIFLVVLHFYWRTFLTLYPSLGPWANIQYYFKHVYCAKRQPIISATLCARRQEVSKKVTLTRFMRWLQKYRTWNVTYSTRLWSTKWPRMRAY